MLKYFVTTFVVGAGLGAFLQYKFYKPETLLVEKEVVRDKIVTKVVEKTAPDGTTTKETDTLEFRITKKDATTVIAPKKLDYAVGATIDLGRNYGLIAQRRLLGDLWLSGQLNQTGQVTLGILYAF